MVVVVLVVVVEVVVTVVVVKVDCGASAIERAIQRAIQTSEGSSNRYMKVSSNGGTPLAFFFCCLENLKQMNEKKGVPP